MSRVAQTVTIYASPQTIKEVLEHVETSHEWAHSLQKVWDVQGRGAGCTFKWTFKVGPTTFNGSTEILELSTERFVMKTSGGIPSTWTWQMTPVSEGTRIDATIDYTVPGSLLGAVADKMIIEKQNQLELDQSLANLKAKLES